VRSARYQLSLQFLGHLLRRHQKRQSSRLPREFRRSWRRPFLEVVEMEEDPEKEEEDPEEDDIWQDGEEAAFADYFELADLGLPATLLGAALDFAGRSD
ncbi:hypothetical protein PIB30_082463, partial [Stylosanthes scabra]|nr:hypothetical protein [Stylosanthes scabra]